MGIDRLPGNLDFLEISRKVTQLRLLPLSNVPLSITNDTSDDVSWHILHPKECVLQVLMDSVGDEFVDIARFTLSEVSDQVPESEQWTCLAGFLTNKSKNWRVCIRNFYPHALLERDTRSSNEFGVFIGLRVEIFEANIDNDPIQRLHALTNAVHTCQSLLDLKTSTSEHCSRTEVDHRALISNLQSEASTIETLYLERARSLHSEAMKKLKKMTEERIEKENALDAARRGLHVAADCWDENWWHDFLSIVQVLGSEQQKHAILSKLADELHIYIEGNRTNMDSRDVSRILLKVVLITMHCPTDLTSLILFQIRRYTNSLHF
jgi:hypothetical protein